MSEIEGGYLKVKKKLWKGVLRDKETNELFWKCSHNHSRPEFNARYKRPIPSSNVVSLSDVPIVASGDLPLVWDVWETSALNCGRAAYRQHMAGEIPEGDIGAIGSDEIPEELRPDMRFIRVSDVDFTGVLRLNDNGHRVIDLWVGDIPDVAAALNLDVARKKGVSLPPSLDSEMLGKVVTALWYLKGTVFGVTFQDYTYRLNIEKIAQLAIEELLIDKRSKQQPGGLRLPIQKLEKKSSGRSYQPGSAPRIEIADREGTRLYEVVSVDGEIIETFRRRGDAATKLKEL